MQRGKDHIRKKIVWLKDPQVNYSDEPYRVPGCRCQTPLSEIEPEDRYDKGMYGEGDLVNDLGVFFNYLPTSEVSRAVHAMFWCLTTALKNRGGIDIKDFAVITVAEKQYEEGQTQVARDSFGVTHRVPRACKRRFIMFREYPQLKAILSPLSKEYFPGNERTWYTWKCSATNQPFYYARHWRRGALYLQQVFDKTFEFTGYTPEYIEMAEANIISPFGAETKHVHHYNLGLECPPYVKAAYTDEVIKVPPKFVAIKFWTDPDKKRDLLVGKITTKEAESYIPY